VSKESNMARRLATTHGLLIKRDEEVFLCLNHG
jgi:hypothetical protein